MRARAHSVVAGATTLSSWAPASCSTSSVASRLESRIMLCPTAPSRVPPLSSSNNASNKGRRVSAKLGGGRPPVIRTGKRGRPSTRKAAATPEEGAASASPAPEPGLRRDCFSRQQLLERKNFATKLFSVFKAPGVIYRLNTILNVLLLLLIDPMGTTARAGTVALGLTWRQLAHVRRFLNTGTLAPETRGGWLGGSIAAADETKIMGIVVSVQRHALMTISTASCHVQPDGRGMGNE